MVVMKFLVDQMLGTLAKWLRLFGFDTFYATQEIHDDELLKIAEKQQRILITRDKELHIRAKKKHIPSLFTKSISLSEQINLVLRTYPELKQKIAPLTRCSICNSIIEPIEKNNVKNKVPTRIFHQHSQFFYCPTCNHIYWQGTHYEKILQTIKNFKNTSTSKKE